MKKQLIKPMIILSSLLAVGAMAGCNNSNNTNTQSSVHQPEHFDGNGAPRNDLGQDGDTYTDLQTGREYTKENGGWVLNHVSQEYTGEGAPDASLGENGDTYIDTRSGAEYEKRNGEWVITKRGDEVYTVTFNLNGGRLPNGQVEIPAQYVREGRWVTEPSVSPTKEHCYFLGWYADGSDNKWVFKGTQVYGDVELVAKYTVQEDQKITFTVDPDNGQAPYTVDSFIGDYCYPTIPRKEGFDFNGWLIKGTETMFNGTVTAALNGATLVAQWGKAAFNVSYQIESNGEATITGILDINSTIVNIPDTVAGHKVTRISSRAFNNRIYIQTIYIPASVKVIEPGAFAGTWRLISINVDSDNTNYVSVNGVLYNKSMTTIECCPTKASAGSGFVLPNTVTKIQDYCFYGSKDMGLTGITFNNGLVEIGNYAFYDNETITSLDFPSTLRKIGKSAFVGSTFTQDGDDYASPQGVLQVVKFNDGLEEIGEGAFANQYFKDTFQLPDSVKVIAPYAFANCTAIVTLVIPANLETLAGSAFNGCTGILDVKTAEGCKNFEAYDKILYTKDMTKLVMCPSGRTEKVVVPNGVTELGDFSFYMVDECQEYEFPSTLTKIGRQAFSQTYHLNSFVIPDSVTEIGIECFYQSGLKSVTIGSGLTSLPEAIFQETGLTSVVIPGNIKSIDYEAFSQTKLTSVTLNEGLEEIGTLAFYNAPIAAVTLPQSLKVIEAGAFMNGKIKTLAFGKNVEKIANDICFNNSTNTTTLETISVASDNPYYSTNGTILFSKDGKTLCFATNTLGENIVIPEGVEKIGDYAFYNLKNVKSYSLPSTLVEIGEFAFGATKVKSFTFPSSLRVIGDGAFGASYVEEVTFNNGLQTIGKEAFRQADLKTVTIPNTVKTIGDFAFYQTMYLNTQINLGTGVETIGEGAFRNSKISGTVTIPASVKTIGEGAFGSDISTYAPRIDNFVVESGNTFYAAQDGLLMNKEKTTVYAFASAKESIVVPTGVTTIANYGLSAGGNSICGVLTTSISLPSTLTYIGDYGLYGNYKVSTLSVPASVQYIGDHAFAYWNMNQAIVFNCTRGFALETFHKDFLSSCNAKVSYLGE